MNKFLTVLGVVCTLFLLGNRSGSTSPASAAVLTVAGASFDDCDVACYSSVCAAEDYHDAWLMEPPYANATRNGGPHNDGKCREGTCDTKHGPMCDLSVEFASGDFEALRRGLVESDLQPVRALLAKHSNVLFVNVARSAVQVSDCEGNVVAHLPLANGTVAALTE
jgi:hypothetical protein